MLTGNEHYVIIKFVSGEQVMAILEHESQDQIHIVNPMLIRMFPIIGQNSGQEHVTATPFCKFADTQTLTIDKSKVLFVKNLHHVLIPHFNRIVEEHSREVLITKEKRAEDLQWEDEPEEVVEEISSLSNEEIRKRIRMLEAIAAETEEEERNFVDGNDTVH